MPYRTDSPIQFLHSEPSVWQIDEDIHLELPCSSLIKPIGLYIAYPPSIPLRQKLLLIECSHPMRESTDQYGNHWLSLNFFDMEKEANWKIHCHALVKVYPIHFSLNSLDSMWPAPPFFLESESGIECDDPSILKLAEQIQGNSLLEILEESFHLVRKNMKYRLKKKEYGAKYAAKKKEGDCTEYASLFAAILRAKKIGARINMGYVGNELHAIAEVYWGGMWVPIEITNAKSFVLGLPPYFITLLRANWISQSTITKTVSFYYESKQEIVPKLWTTIHVTNYSNSKAKILQNTKEVFHSLSYVNQCCLHGNVTVEKNFCQILVFNTNTWPTEARLLLVGKNEVLWIKPFHISACETLRWHFSKRDLSSYFLEYPKLEWHLLDHAEQSMMIGEIQKSDFCCVVDLQK